MSQASTSAPTVAEHLQVDPSHSEPVTRPAQELPDPHLQMLLSASHTSFVAHLSKEVVHLHTLLTASQTAPVDWPIQEESIEPHLQAPDVHTSSVPQDKKLSWSHLHIPWRHVSPEIAHVTAEQASLGHIKLIKRN